MSIDLAKFIERLRNQDTLTKYMCFGDEADAIESLMKDAARWRTLESMNNVVDNSAPIATHFEKREILEDAGYVYRKQKIPVREIKIRWADKDGDRTTLRELVDSTIDAALAERGGE